MSVSLKRQPRTTPPTPTPVAKPTAPAPDVPPDAPYRGDTYGLWIWIGCAILLVVLHVIEPVFYWLRK